MFLRKLVICFKNMVISSENMTFSKEVNYLFRKSYFSFEYLIFQEINYLLRKYDLFIQGYAKVTHQHGMNEFVF